MTKTEMARVSAVALAFACGSAGCASIAAANKRSPGVIENGNFRPTLPAAETYGPNPKYVCPTNPINSGVQGTLNDRFKGKTAPDPEGRLCAVAETLLSWPTAEAGDTAPESIRNFLANYFGLVSPLRPPILASFETDDSRMLTDPLTEPIASFAEDAKVPRYGLVTERTKQGNMTAGDLTQGKSKGGTRAVIAVQDQNFELTAPLPRKIAPGGSAQLSGRVLAPATKIKTEIVDASGKLQTIKSQDQTVTAQLSCGDRPGRILVQVAGEREGVDVQFANFMVSCGGELATSVPVPGKETATTSEQDEKRLLELINKEREAAGQKPLESNSGLADISRKISDDRGKGKPTTSSQLIQAMRDADIGSPVILESAIQAFNGDNAFERLANSPSERATILNADANQIGIGVAKGPMVGKVPTVIATALLIKQVPPADPAEIKKSLYDAMVQRRKDARAEALTRDPVLEDVAQKYADAAAAAGGQVAPEKLTEILAPLYKQSMTVNQVGGFLPDAKGAVEVAQQPSVVGKGNLVGVGVALGRSPQFGKNAPFVVVFFGTRHQAPKGAGKPGKAAKKK